MEAAAWRREHDPTSVEFIEARQVEAEIARQSALFRLKCAWGTLAVALVLAPTGVIFVIIAFVAFFYAVPATFGYLSGNYT